jgi:hypothetical protein
VSDGVERKGRPGLLKSVLAGGLLGTAAVPVPWAGSVVGAVGGLAWWAYCYVDSGEPAAACSEWLRRRRLAAEAKERQDRAEAAARKAKEEADCRAREWARKEEERIRNLPTPEQKMAQAAARYNALVAALEAAGLDEVELREAKSEAKRRLLKAIDKEVLP